MVPQLTVRVSGLTASHDKSLIGTIDHIVTYMKKFSSADSQAVARRLSASSSRTSGSASEVAITCSIRRTR